MNASELYKIETEHGITHYSYTPEDLPTDADWVVGDVQKV